MSTFQYVILGAGVLSLLTGALLAITRLRTLLQGVAVEGTVVAQKTSTITNRNDRTTTLARPVVEFRHEGKAYRFDSSLGQKAVLPEGAKVPVRFLPSDPQGTAEVDTPMAMWGFPIAALAFGGICLWGGLQYAGILPR